MCCLASEPGLDLNLLLGGKGVHSDQGAGAFRTSASLDDLDTLTLGSLLITPESHDSAVDKFPGRYTIYAVVVLHGSLRYRVFAMFLISLICDSVTWSYLATTLPLGS